MPVLSTGERLTAREWTRPRHGERMHLDLATLPEVFLAAEAAADVGARRLRAAVAAGTAVRLGRGLYADPSRWPADRVDRHRLMALAAQRAVSGSALSHVSAAAAQGLPNPMGDLPRPSVTVDDQRRSRSPGSWMTLYRGELPSGHVESNGSVRRTVASRTVVDCARHLTTGDGLAVADAALRAGKATAAGVREMREFQTRWPGSQKTEVMLAQLDPRREGWLESWSADAFRRMELPRWIPQVNVYDAHDRFVGRVDGYWPDLGVAAEADGRGKYLGDVDPSLDRSPDAVAQRVVEAGERESSLRGCGLGLVRWTTKEITTAQLRVRARWRAEVARTDPRGIRATLTCSCCNAPVTSCDLGTVFPAPGR
jgi:hypothetical protein